MTAVKQTVQMSIDKGVFTTITAAEIMDISRAMVYHLISNGKLDCFINAEKRNKRITAPAIHRYLKSHGYPISTRLMEAVNNFYLTYTEEGGIRNSDRLSTINTTAEINQQEDKERKRQEQWENHNSLPSSATG